MTSVHDPLLAWFDSQGWTPQPFQQSAWDACAEGKSGLIQSPTGSGKTYAVLGHVLASHVGKPERAGLKVLWISPLRALSSDIASAAERMVEGLGLNWEVGIRTGDTSSKVKAAQKARLPDILVTTPESLHVLIAQRDSSKLFRSMEMMVVDEWHALVGSKRGVQVELAWSWMHALDQRRNGKPMLLWGMSATMANPTQAMEVLMGTTRKGCIVANDANRPVELVSLMPKAFEPLPWAGHIGLQLLGEVVDVIQQHRSTLVFANTRRQSEIWYQAILDAHPEFAGQIAVHHGSLSKELRAWVEEALHHGGLKAVICTASLDLGVDFHPVDAVVQIGGPKGVSRMIQRAGRAGHRPGLTSKVHFVPTHGLELVEAVALREAMQGGEVEPREPLIQCWDVLHQWLCTLAVGEGFEPDKAWAMVKSTHAFCDATKEDWAKVLEALTTGGAALRAYSEHQRLVFNEGQMRMPDRSKARRHRMSMGTIVSATMVAVKLKGHGFLGHIEESFVASLKEGESFVFAGHHLELVSLAGLVAKVKRSNSKATKIPAWMGGRMSLSSELSNRLREAWDRMATEGGQWEPELQRIAPLVQHQASRSKIPRKHELLVESYQDKDGHHLFMYPFEGRKMHEALASLLAYRLALLKPQSFNWACNDDGIEWLSDQPIDWEAAKDNDLLSPLHLMDDLSAGFNASELAKRKFRDVATIAGLMFKGFPGAEVKERHLLTSTNLLYEVLSDHDPDNLLLRQAHEEMLSDQLEFARLHQWLTQLPSKQLVEVELSKPSPLAFPLFVDRLRERMSTETLEDRLRKMAWS